MTFPVKVSYKSNRPALMDIEDKKAGLRKALRERRKQAHAADASAAAVALARNLASLPLLPGATIAGYVAHGSEIDPLPALLDFARAGHPLCLPVVIAPGRPLVFRSWEDGLALEAGEFEIPVPVGGDELLPDVVLVPLVGFDRRGGRLGQGGGFYDRSLPTLRAAKPSFAAIGLAFSIQEVASVPRAATDAALDWVVTEKETIEIKP